MSGTTNRTPRRSGATTGAPAAAPVAVIANAASGSSVDEHDLREAFTAAGVDATRWLPTSEDDPGTGQARDAVAAGASTVVACGGDGTVRAVLEGVAGTPATLAVVPLGTGNLLAGNLGVPSGLDAVPHAVTGTTRRLDVGTVNGERFAVMAGVGFDAAMIRDADPALKRRLGSLAYVLSAARQLNGLRDRVFRAHVEVGDDSWMGSTVMVLVGNCSSVTGGLTVFPDAEPDDGQLDVAIVAARGLRQWASVAGRLLLGREQRPDLVHRLCGPEVTVRLDRPRAYELDGEVRPPAATLRFGIEPGAIEVRVPNDDSSAGPS